MKTIYLIIMFGLAISIQAQTISTQTASDSIYNNYTKDFPYFVESEIVSIEITDVLARSMQFYITQTTKIVIQSEIKSDDLPFLTIPYSFDPAASIIAPRMQKLTSDWSGVRDPSLKATLIRSGLSSELKTFDSDKTEITGNWQYMQGSYTPLHVMYDKTNYSNYKISESLKMGDTLIIETKYHAPFVENCEKMQYFRYFFHRKYPVKNSFLQISMLSRLWHNLELFNFNRPDTIVTVDNAKIYQFSFHNLSAVFSEPNIIAWRELPYIMFVPHLIEFYYTIPNTLTEKPLPMQAYFAQQRDRAGIGIRMDIDQGVNNKETIGYKHFIEKQILDCKECKDSLDILEKIHNYIATSFIYSNDSAYYFNTSSDGINAGESAEAGVLREFWRYDSYKYILSKLHRAYFFGFIADKRSGVISTSDLSSMTQGDYIFAIVHDSTHYDFIYPKMSKTGYYLNELPFYFEGTDFVAMHYLDYILDPKSQKEIPAELWISKTPRTDIGSNFRKMNSLVSINSTKQTIQFHTRGSLSGQFSTLGRGSYLNNEIHPFVSEKYSHKIFEIPGSKLTEKAKYTTSSSKPFRFGIECKYETPVVIKNKEASICLSDWFPYVLPQIGANQRSAAVYSDFLFQDQISYQLVFDKSAILIDSVASYSIANDFGQFEFSISAVNENTYTIASSLIITREVLAANNIQALKEILAAIEYINTLTLHFELK